jgi:hypothetical protein
VRHGWGCWRRHSAARWPWGRTLRDPMHRHLFVFNFITAQTYGHNFGPDALARKRCRARVLAALGRALGVWGHTSPFRRTAPSTTPSAKSKSERTRSALVLVLAAVGALQLRRSRRDGGASKCDGTVRKRNYRYHLRQGPLTSRTTRKAKTTKKDEGNDQRRPSQHERTRGTRPHTCINTAQGNSVLGQIDAKEAARHIAKDC